MTVPSLDARIAACRLRSEVIQSFDEMRGQRYLLYLREITRIVLLICHPEPVYYAFWDAARELYEERAATEPGLWPVFPMVPIYPPKQFPDRHRGRDFALKGVVVFAN